MLGGFHGHKSGHGLNNQLVRKLLSEPDSYEIVTFDQGDQVPEAYARQSTEAA
jgi:UDP-3-O-[3-hydroxymyristoyl] N-acetylglucosamine deacetylase